MVRRASRLPPNAKSLEEVVLDRIANGGASPSSSGHLPTSASQRKPSAAVPTSRRTTVKTTDTAPIDSASTKSSISSPLLPASTGTMERIESMATELSQLDQRLQSVATTATSISTATRRRSGSARHSIDGNPSERESHRDQIEQYIRQSMVDVHTAYGTHTSTNAAAATTTELPSTKRSKARATYYDPAQGAHVNHAVRDLRSTVRRLDKVFYEVATGDKQRHIAATKIATLVRGFIMRRRYRKMKYALGQWRARKCAVMLTFLEQFSAREEFLNHQIQRLHEERTQSFLRRVIAEIRDVALLNLPLRRRRLEETERRFQSKQRLVVKSVWLAWKNSALGPRSCKRVRVEAKLRHQAARQRLEALDRFDVITNEMVHEEFLKENIRIVRGAHPQWLLKTYFQLMLRHEYLPMKRKLALAKSHVRRKLLMLVWRVWLPAFKAAQVDRAIAKVNERRTLERFDQHHNLRKIDAHYRHTHLRKHVKAWALYGQRIRRVRRLFEDNTKHNMAQIVQRWHVRARYQRGLRAHSVEFWRDYCRRIFQTPFRAWYNFAACRRASRQAKESICVAYQRRQRRHTKYTFFRLWKHQVLFGNIEGIHSKVHLLRSLEDQKRLSLGLESNAKLYQQNIHALQQSIQALEARLTDKQLELIQQQDATQATRFSIHSAEQSIARVQGMLEAVRQIHPGTLERIEKMFAENPLLTQDLKQVVALHVSKRRDVLEKIGLDDDELEIQAATGASDGAAGGLSRGDQLLLHRVKWVFSRLDLKAYETPLTNGQRIQQIKTQPSEQVVSRHTLDQLCALFEFIRDGEPHILSSENDPSHPRSMSVAATSEGDTGTVARVLDRDDLVDASETWHSFLRALTVKFAPERMLKIKERLVKRAAEMDDELDTFKANHQIYNAYR